MHSTDDKDEFAKYVREIKRVQRNHVATKIEKLNRHVARDWQYFLGTIFGVHVCFYAAILTRGPRNFTREAANLIYPLPFTFSASYALYSMTYTARSLLMRAHIVQVIDDYEYELKRVKGHHCEDGMTQLAWLEFVLYQVKSFNEYRFDPDKLREC